MYMSIKQKEIWLIEFYPNVGKEIGKKRPAIVVNHNIIGKLPLKVIVPITTYQAKFASYPWMYKIEPNSLNNLTKTSVADCFQIKNISEDRFIKKLGEISDKELFEIHQKIVKVLNPVYSI